MTSQGISLCPVLLLVPGSDTYHHGIAAQEAGRLQHWSVLCQMMLTALPAVQGYLAALSASSYSYVSMLQRFGPLMNKGGAAISLTYIASERIIPGRTELWTQEITSHKLQHTTDKVTCLF